MDSTRRRAYLERLIMLEINKVGSKDLMARLLFSVGKCNSSLSLLLGD